MTRIPLLNGDDLTPEQQRVYDKIVDGPRGVMVGPLRAALHWPELAERWQALGETLRYHLSLSARLSELSIILVARHWNSYLEWDVHAEAARASGLSNEVIEAVRNAQPPTFVNNDEAVIYEYTRQLLQTGQVDDGAYDEALQLFGTVPLVELTAVIGYYSMVAITLNAHNILLPRTDGKPRMSLAAVGTDRHGLTPLPISEPQKVESTAF